MQKGMQESYDVAVIGGPFSGAATALLLKGFEPNWHFWKLILRGVQIWLRAELRSLFLPALSSAPVGSPASAV